MKVTRNSVSTISPDYTLRVRKEIAYTIEAGKGGNYAVVKDDNIMTVQIATGKVNFAEAAGIAQEICRRLGLELIDMRRIEGDDVVYFIENDPEDTNAAEQLEESSSSA